MNKIDLSSEALQKRREIAENATKGPWEIDYPETTSGWGFCVSQTSGVGNHIICQIKSDRRIDTTKPDLPFIPRQKVKEMDAAHIAINSPVDVIAMIDEIERLRKEIAELKNKQN